MGKKDIFIVKIEIFVVKSKGQKSQTECPIQPFPVYFYTIDTMPKKNFLAETICLYGFHQKKEGWDGDRLDMQRSALSQKGVSSK